MSVSSIAHTWKPWIWRRLQRLESQSATYPKKKWGSLHGAGVSSFGNAGTCPSEAEVPRRAAAARDRAEGQAVPFLQPGLSA